MSRINPTCGFCKKIQWEGIPPSMVVSFLHKHAHLHFTHCLCPACTKNLYPDLIKK